jgi:hypothetical protein
MAQIVVVIYHVAVFEMEEEGLWVMEGGSLSLTDLFPS